MMLAGDLEGTQRRNSVFFDLFLTARGCGLTWMMLAGDLEGTQRRNSVPVNGPVTSYTGLDLDVTPLQGGGKWVEKEFPKFGGRGGGEKKGWGLGWFFWVTVGSQKFLQRGTRALAERRGTLVVPGTVRGAVGWVRFGVVSLPCRQMS